MNHCKNKFAAPKWQFCGSAAPMAQEHIMTLKKWRHHTLLRKGLWEMTIRYYDELPELQFSCHKFCMVMVVSESLRSTLVWSKFSWERMSPDPPRRTLCVIWVKKDARCACRTAASNPLYVCPPFCNLWIRPCAAHSMVILKSKKGIHRLFPLLQFCQVDALLLHPPYTYKRMRLLTRVCGIHIPTNSIVRDIFHCFYKWLFIQQSVTSRPSKPS